LGHIIAIIDDLGFIIHPEKSVFIPSQELILLGFIINSIDMTITLTPEKKLALQQLCVSLLSKHTPTIREVAQVIGKSFHHSRGWHMGLYIIEP
jgi:hypothetical protein